MEVYEIVCDPPIDEAFTFRFNTVDDAIAQAKTLCLKHHCAVRVVRVIGSVSPYPHWISAGVPGCP